MKTLDHPNCVKFHECYESTGKIYIVMEVARARHPRTPRPLPHARPHSPPARRPAVLHWRRAARAPRARGRALVARGRGRARAAPRRLAVPPRARRRAPRPQARELPLPLAGPGRPPQGAPRRPHPLQPGRHRGPNSTPPLPHTPSSRHDAPTARGAQIGDFGLAARAALGGRAAMETVCGTPLYMAPEIVGLGRYSAQAQPCAVERPSVKWPSVTRLRAAQPLRRRCAALARGGAPLPPLPLPAALAWSGAR